jgi:hypothetical protein
MKPARRGVAAGSAFLLAVALASSGCATTSDDSKKAFAEAGRQVRRRQPPPTNRELLEEMDRYIADDLAFTQEKARTREQKAGSTWRLVGIVGVGVAVAGLTSGSLSGSRTAEVLGGVGAAAGALGLVEYYVQTGKMRGCQTYVAGRAAFLRGWANRRLKDTDDPVSPEVWREWVDQTAEIEAYPKCLPVR